MASAHHTGTRALPKRAASPVGLMRARPLLIEPSRAARRALFQITTLPMLSLKPRLALALLLVVGVFTADLFEPADNVSICFAYTLPILLGVYMGPGSTFRLAALATAASLVGSFIRPPEGGIVLSFVVNRVIAVAAQWLVAFLVEQRRRNHALVDARLTEERLVAETGRRFVQILTHEIATALTAIDGQGYRLGKLAQTIEPMDIIARSEKIRHAATRLKGLVERVRLAAEVGRGEILLNREAIEAVPFLEALVAEYEAAHVHIAVCVAEPTLHGDRVLIHQAVSNLVSNAIKYSPQPCAISIHAGRSALLDGSEITVADHGVGIALEELDRVFEPYYRAANSGGVPGLGIGLHLVRHFVEAHGGQVRIESQVDRGTTVHLHLPGAKP
ncbi:signal transduction histidine kinase [Methylobacterium sp. PvP062]|uniref:histidine kinase n=2 Tax=Methylobacterium TaxID=407 RepID=A0ABV2NTE7_9HYPH|nr:MULTISPECIES: HAMP domain-containing sensor histidine kinase [Methylobacterium]MBN6822391.1 HAMP domain-containing histidine kinase [Methylobacterium organophilum]MBP2498907.1 signal transduction histidine kinase [Methylobacterium sp. PvP105]MBP2506331.1 signal transduction histidine kinase [Methylobacterium sp. PvP109]MDQ0444909.1 signal transduction histidine kinase [Methylobacterium persicinum]MWV25153.1 HAMP domain-containing histidine kinase [Methylobacterium sp. 2A]